MGSTNKKSKNKEKEGKKRHHRSRSSSVELVKAKDKHRHHKRHHKDKRHKARHHGYESEGSDVAPPSPPNIVHSYESPPPPPTITIRDDSSDEELLSAQQPVQKHSERRHRHHRKASSPSPEHVVGHHKISPERSGNHRIRISPSPDKGGSHRNKYSPSPERGGNQHRHSPLNHRDYVSSPDGRGKGSSHRNKISPSPEKGGGAAESLSIQETNKLRAKLGLKPLQDTKSTPSGPSDDGKKKDDLGEFYHKPADNISSKTAQEKLKRRLAEKRERREIEHKLARVKTLGASDSDDDTSAWVERNRRIQQEKEQAAKRARMLEELDAELGVGTLVEQATKEQRNKAYTERHLKGLTVEHDMDEFQEGTTTILTLKDHGVLDEDDDTLINVNLLDDERYKKSLERKKQKPDYNPFDDVDQFDEFGQLREKALLSKYDEEIDGEKKKSFAIGSDIVAERRRQIALMAVKDKLANKRVESLDLPQLKLASEYYTEEEMTKFKKPKRKVKGRKMREKGKMLKADDLEVLASTSNDNDYLRDLGSRRKKQNNAFVDIDDTLPVNVNSDEIKAEIENEDADTELELALRRARRLRTQNILTTPKLPEIKPEPVVKEEPMDQDNAGNIVLNATAEFCRTLGDIPTYGRAGNRDEDEELLEFENDLNGVQKMDVEDEDFGGRSGAWNTVELETSNGRSALDPVQSLNPEPILDEEPDVSRGVGAALKLAMSKGYLDKEDNNRPSTSRLAHLQAKNYSIEDKTHGDDDKFGRRDRYSGPVMDFKEKDGFKPNVKLDYIDDEGHVLNAKEAFRYLSHKFHGKGPGKNKIEKRIKKNEQEALMKKMSSTDTPLGTLGMLTTKQKETQSPFIVLSGSKHTNSTTISKTKH